MHKGAESMTAFERRVMDVLLAGDHPVLAALRAQYATCTLDRRETVDDSLSLYFEVDPALPRVSPPGFMVGDAWLELAGCPDGADASLFVKGGALHVLEGWVVEGDWPRVLVIQTLRYAVRRFKWGHRMKPSDTRDLEALVRSWSP